MAAVSTTTTNQTTTTSQDVTNLVVSTQSSTQSVGNYITDVTLNPYIKSQPVYFSAYNMRPGQTVHAFFDKVLVDQYCAPADPNNPTTSSNVLLSSTNLMVTVSDFVTLYFELANPM